MTPRLASAVLVAALIRRAEAEGGFGAVLAKGDETAGAIAVILAERGRKKAFLERLLQPGDGYTWRDSGEGLASDSAYEDLLARRRRVDPDLWAVELDVASAERFAAEMNAIG